MGQNTSQCFRQNILGPKHLAKCKTKYTLPSIHEASTGQKNAPSVQYKAKIGLREHPNHEPIQYVYHGHMSYEHNA